MIHDRLADTGHPSRGRMIRDVPMTMHFRLSAALLVATGATLTLSAQGQAPALPPAKPDTPAITARIEQLRRTAGPRWAPAVHFYCEAPRANAATDPPIEPAKIFD